jgi:hypothetical protein
MILCSHLTGYDHLLLEVDAWQPTSIGIHRVTHQVIDGGAIVLHEPPAGWH